MVDHGGPEALDGFIGPEDDRLANQRRRQVADLVGHMGLGLDQRMQRRVGREPVPLDGHRTTEVIAGIHPDPGCVARARHDLGSGDTQVVKTVRNPGPAHMAILFDIAGDRGRDGFSTTNARYLTLLEKQADDSSRYR